MRPHTKSVGRPERSLRIAMLGHKGIPALHGGIERHVDEIARRLVQRGHRVDVFNRPYHPYRQASYEGIRLLRRPSLQTKHLDAGTHTAICLAEVLWSRRYDVLHLHGIGPGIFVGLASRFVPTVFTFHAQDWRQRKWGRWARWWLLRAEAVAVQEAHAVITVSELLRTYVRDRYRREAHFIPNGASVRQPAVADRLAKWNLEPGSYLLFVGRLIPDRGVGHLLRAYAGIRTDLRLVIVGDVQDPEHAEELRCLADERVVFAGYRSGEDLDQLYAHAYLCVHPSEVEGLPIAVLEAMGHGRAVLVSDIPENLEAIGDAGACFPVRDTEALRRKLEDLLDSPDCVRELGARARLRAAAVYDWDRIALETEAVYRSVVQPAQRLEPMETLAPSERHVDR